MDRSLPGSSVHWIFQARILDWVAFASPGDFPDPGNEPRSPVLQADSLTSELLGKHVKVLNWYDIRSVNIFLNIVCFWFIKSLSHWNSVPFSSVQSISRVRLFVTQWIAARQASRSITISWSSLKLTSIESVMPSSHLILCHPLLPLPPIIPESESFPYESTLCTRWP